MALLEAANLSVVVEGRALFHGIGLTVEAGDSLAVVGPSGSGKSSFLSVLAGLSRPTEGEVRFDGTPLTGPTGPPPAGVALILQGYGLVSLLTTSENVYIALRAGGAAIADATTRTAEALRQVGLATHADQLVETLSGGQQQRTAIARALALRPRLLIADEPTAELDPASRVLVLSRLLEANAAGCALIVATHDPDVASRCGRSIELRRSVLSDD